MVTLKLEGRDFRHANRDGKRDVGSLPIHTGLRIHQTRGGKPEANYGFRGIPGEGRGNDLQLSSGSDGNRLLRRLFTNYCSMDGALFSADGKTLIGFPAGRTGSYAAQWAEEQGIPVVTE